MFALEQHTHNIFSYSETLSPGQESSHTCARASRAAGYSRSRRKASSVAGSARTMSGSLSMCRPSSVSGSIFRSSKGNWESTSKLTSVDSEPVRSLGRLGGDSPLTEERQQINKYKEISEKISVHLCDVSKRRRKSAWLKLEKNSLTTRRERGLGYNLIKHL